VVQRVSSGAVSVAGAVVGAIEQGLVILLGIGAGDGEAEARLLAEKIAHMRIFGDAEGRFNLSLLDVGGAALVISQFTLYADTRRGRRPSFSEAALPELAQPLVERFCAALRALGVTVETGRFGAMMRVELVNEGPVTIMLDTQELARPRSRPAGA
jgi:D-tyrosyl-tRNA(Tyr) deacylase